MAFFKVLPDDTVDQLQEFIDRGGDLAAQDADGNTALIWAIKHDNFNIIDKLLQFKPIEINLGAQDADGNTALIWSVRSGVKFNKISLKILEFTPTQNNLLAKNRYDSTALTISELINNQPIISKISQIYHIIFIPMNHKVTYYDQTSKRTRNISIKQYISEEPGNIVIKYNMDKFYFTKRHHILNDQGTNLLYPCINADGIVEHNYNLREQLYDLRADDVPVNPIYLKTMYINTDTQLFVVVDNGKTVPSLVSHAVAKDGRSVIDTLNPWSSTYKCQPGLDTKVNDLYVGMPFENSPVNTGAAAATASGTSSGGGKKKRASKKRRQSKSKRTQSRRKLKHKTKKSRSKSRSAGKHKRKSKSKMKSTKRKR